jgi:hypothetical protein
MDTSQIQHIVSVLSLVGVVLAAGTALAALLAAALPYLKGSDALVKVTTLVAGALGVLGAVVGVSFYHYSDELDRSRMAEQRAMAVSLKNAQADLVAEGVKLESQDVELEKAASDLATTKAKLVAVNEQLIDVENQSATAKMRLAKIEAPLANLRKEFEGRHIDKASAQELSETMKEFAGTVILYRFPLGSQESQAFADQLSAITRKAGLIGYASPAGTRLETFETGVTIKFDHAHLNMASRLWRALESLGFEVHHIESEDVLAPEVQECCHTLVMVNVWKKRD